MSYDINFWKQTRKLVLSPEQIYRKLCENEYLEGLATLPIDKIYSRLQAEFPGFDPTASLKLIELEECGIEVSSSPQYVRFDLRGGDIAPSIHNLAAIMAEFDCPMYDPQINQRFDKKGGTELGKPPFSKISSNIRAKFREQRKLEAQRILDRMKDEQTTKSESELTVEESTFIAIERKFWLGDWDTYQESLSAKVFAVYPRPLGVVWREKLLGAAQVMNTVTGPTWSAVSFSEIRITYPASDVALVVYHVDARQALDNSPYGAMASSMYVNEKGRWLLAFNQQSPDLERPFADI